MLAFLSEDEPAALAETDVVHKHMPADAARNAIVAVLDVVRTTEQYDVDTLRATLMPIGEQHTKNGTTNCELHHILRKELRFQQIHYSLMGESFKPDFCF